MKLKLRLLETSNGVFRSDTPRSDPDNANCTAPPKTDGVTGAIETVSPIPGLPLKRRVRPALKVSKEVPLVMEKAGKMLSNWLPLTVMIYPDPLM